VLASVLVACAFELGAVRGGDSSLGPDGATAGSDGNANGADGSGANDGGADGAPGPDGSAFDASPLDAPLEARPPRVTSGLVALYAFEEDGGATVHDTSGAGGPLDLTIVTMGGSTFVPGGLQITQPTIIASSAGATKISAACRAADAITVELWVQPANTTQTGATLARIGGTLGSVNIDVDQEGSFFSVRPYMSSGGGGATVDTANATATTSLTHFVTTLAPGGAARIYLNGAMAASRSFNGDLSQWSDSYPLLLGNEQSGSDEWRGTFYLAAFYARALSATEVAQNYAAGP
jgi:hypothetical protein